MDDSINIIFEDIKVVHDSDVEVVEVIEVAANFDISEDDNSVISIANGELSHRSRLYEDVEIITISEEQNGHWSTQNNSHEASINNQSFKSQSQENRIEDVNLMPNEREDHDVEVVAVRKVCPQRPRRISNRQNANQEESRQVENQELPAQENRVPSQIDTASNGDSRVNDVRTNMICCPICLQTLYEIKSSGHYLMALKCGHVLCDECLPLALEAKKNCPQCRKRINKKDYHRLHV